MSHERLDDLKRFYAVLTVLEKNLGGARRLSGCSGRMIWPKRGVYFFQESGECCTDTGDGHRGYSRDDRAGRRPWLAPRTWLTEVGQRYEAYVRRLRRLVRRIFDLFSNGSAERVQEPARDPGGNRSDCCAGLSRDAGLGVAFEKAGNMGER